MKKKSSPYSWAGIDIKDALAKDEDHSFLDVVDAIDKKKNWSGLKKEVYATFYLKNMPMPRSGERP